jgi:hypothetical protein
MDGGCKTQRSCLPVHGWSVGLTGWHDPLLCGVVLCEFPYRGFQAGDFLLDGCEIDLAILRKEK